MFRIDGSDQDNNGDAWSSSSWWSSNNRDQWRGGGPWGNHPDYDGAGEEPEDIPGCCRKPDSKPLRYDYYKVKDDYLDMYNLKVDAQEQHEVELKLHHDAHLEGRRYLIAQHNKETAALPQAFRAEQDKAGPAIFE